jgi:hypothetical protein
MRSPEGNVRTVLLALRDLNLKYCGLQNLSSGGLEQNLEAQRCLQHARRLESEFNNVNDQK